jgi:hypothetical protein
VTFNKVIGSGTLTLAGWSGCQSATYNLNTDNFTGNLAIHNGITRDGGGTFTIGIGNIETTGATSPGSRVLKLSQTADDGITGTVVYNLDTATLNGERADLEVRTGGIYVAGGEVVPTQGTFSTYSTYSADETVTSSSAGNSNIDWQSFKLNADNWIYCTSEDDIAETASKVSLDSVTVYWGSGTHSSAHLGYPGDTSDSYIVLTTTNDVVVGISHVGDAKWTASGSSTYTFEGVAISPNETYRLRFVTSQSGVSVGETLSSSVSARVTCVWHGSQSSLATGDSFIRTNVTAYDGKFSAKCDISVSSLATIKLVGGTATLADTPYNDGLGSNSAGRYRVPAIAKSTNGVVVALYDCRYYNSADLGNHANVQIDSAESWSGDNGQSWTHPRIGIDVPNTNAYDKSCNFGDPCILFDPAGNKFWAMGITGGGLASPRDTNGNSISDVVLYTRGTEADDEWEEWTGGPAGNERSVKQVILDALAGIDSNASSDENAIRGILQGPGHGMVQQKTVTNEYGEVIMPAGALVFPMQYFSSFSNFNDAMTFAVYSTDGGATWKSTKLTQADQNAQENCVMELDDGSWYMICKGRTNSDKKRQLFRTTDYVNWSYCGNLTPSEWVQGGCLKLGRGADGTGRYVACFSPSGRSNITLYFGRDTTVADPTGLGVEWDCGSTNIYPYATGNMGYNSLVMLDNTTLGVLLETNGHISFITTDVSDVLEMVIERKSPEEVAAWNGDFDGEALVQEKGRLVDPQKTHDDNRSSVTIDHDSQGLLFDSNSPMGGLTVIVKYSGLEPGGEGTNRVLFASSVNSGYKYDRTGIQLTSDGKLVGLWNDQTNDNNDANNGTASGSIASSGVMAFTYSTGGTYLYYGETSSTINANQVWGSSGLKSSSDTKIYGAGIGGMYREASRVSAEAAKGMTIYSVAVFDRVLTVSEMRSYEWPEPEERPD